VERLIDKAKLEWLNLHGDDTDPGEMMLPLIRLKVGRSDTQTSCSTSDAQVETSEAKEMTNPVRFGQDFIGRTANPRDILQYYRRKVFAGKSKQSPSADIQRSRLISRSEECT
jgi:double-strand break repair protein MRE11